MWIDYLYKVLALMLGYSLRSRLPANERKRAAEHAADNAADAKFGK